MLAPDAASVLHALFTGTEVRHHGGESVRDVMGADLAAYCDTRLPVASSDRAKAVRISLDSHSVTSLV
jgi:DNA-binding ferritin-like protein (Dps family)